MINYLPLGCSTVAHCLPGFLSDPVVAPLRHSHITLTCEVRVFTNY